MSSSSPSIEWVFPSPGGRFTKRFVRQPSLFKPPASRRINRGRGSQQLRPTTHPRYNDFKGCGVTVDAFGREYAVLSPGIVRARRADLASDVITLAMRVPAVARYEWTFPNIRSTRTREHDMSTVRFPRASEVVELHEPDREERKCIAVLRVSGVECDPGVTSSCLATCRIESVTDVTAWSKFLVESSIRAHG